MIIKINTVFIHYAMNVSCPACNSSLLPNSVEEQESPQQETPESTPEFEEDLKKFKKMNIEKKKSLAALQPIIRTACNSFKENTEYLVTQIKELKKQAIEEIKSKEEYRIANTMIRKVIVTHTKLYKKYPTKNIPTYYTHFRRRNLSRILKYKFRLKGI